LDQDLEASFGEETAEEEADDLAAAVGGAD
jgi:hypothetical protein